MPSDEIDALCVKYNCETDFGMNFFVQVGVELGLIIMSPSLLILPCLFRKRKLLWYCEAFLPAILWNRDLRVDLVIFP